MGVAGKMTFSTYNWTLFFFLRGEAAGSVSLSSGGVTK